LEFGKLIGIIQQRQGTDPNQVRSSRDQRRSAG
jgi:hypothetical protein